MRRMQMNGPGVGRLDEYPERGPSELKTWTNCVYRTRKRFTYKMSKNK